MNYSHLSVDSFAWTDSSEDGDRSRLLATLTIDRVDFHVEAYEAKVDENGIQQFIGSYGDTAEQVYYAVTDEGPWYTVTIQGREYVLIITPYCQ